MIRKVIFILVCLVALSSCHWNGGKSSDSAELNIKSTSVRMKTNSDIPQTKLRISSEKYRNSGLSKSKV